MAKERLKMEISHDVRTPLNAVVGFAELLAESDVCQESKLGTGKSYRKMLNSYWIM